MLNTKPPVTLNEDGQQSSMYAILGLKRGKSCFTETIQSNKANIFTDSKYKKETGRDIEI